MRRQSERFPEFGKVYAPSLSSLPGIVDDVSREGCKIRFAVSVNFDTENDCVVDFVLSQVDGEKRMSLMCRPKWVRRSENSTEIGMGILPALDYTQFLSYVDCISNENKTQEVQIVGSVCRFV